VKFWPAPGPEATPFALRLVYLVILAWAAASWLGLP
jgi:hypothetical protein